MKSKTQNILTAIILTGAVNLSFTAPAVDLRSIISERKIDGRHQGNRNTGVLHSMSFLQEYALTGIFGSEYNNLSEEFIIQAGNRIYGEQNESSTFRKYNSGYNAYGIVSDSLWLFYHDAVFNYNTWNEKFNTIINEGTPLLQDGYRLAGKCFRGGDDGIVSDSQVIEEVIQYLNKGIPVAVANAGHSTAIIGYERTSARAGGGYFIYRDSYADHPYGEYNFVDLVGAGQNYVFFVYEIAQAFPTCYNNTDFTGPGYALAPGRYTKSQLYNTGIDDNSISSIKVPSGYSAYLYTEDNFTGTLKLLTSTECNLASINMDNSTTSIIILKSTSNMEEPCFYLENSAQGTTQNLGDVLAPKMTGDFTIEMWVNPGTTQQTYADIVDFNHRNNIGMVIQQVGTNTNLFGFSLGDGTTSSGISWQLQAGVWQHVAFEREGTILRLFIDGKLVTSGSCFSGDVYYLPNSSVTVQYNVNYGRYFNGSIKGLKFWNYAKSYTSLLGESLYRTTFDFNGTNGINLGDKIVSRMSKNFSIEMMIKPGSTQQTYADIIDFNHRGNIGFVIQQNGTTTNNFCFGLGNGSTTSAVSYQLTANTWQTVKFERKGTSINLYVNNALVSTQNCFSGEVYFLPGSSATLGYNANFGRYFNGSISNVKFDFY